MKKKEKDEYRRLGAQLMDNAWQEWERFCVSLVVLAKPPLAEWVMYQSDEEDVWGNWIEWEWWEYTPEEWWENDPDIDPGEMDPNWGEGGVYIDEY